MSWHSWCNNDNSIHWETRDETNEVETVFRVRIGFTVVYNRFCTEKYIALQTTWKPQKPLLPNNTALFARYKKSSSRFLLFPNIMSILEGNSCLSIQKICRVFSIQETDDETVVNKHCTVWKQWLNVFHRWSDKRGRKRDSLKLSILGCFFGMYRYMIWVETKGIFAFNHFLKWLSTFLNDSKISETWRLELHLKRSVSWDIDKWERDSSWGEGWGHLFKWKNRLR